MLEGSTVLEGSTALEEGRITLEVSTTLERTALEEGGCRELTCAQAVWLQVE